MALPKQIQAQAQAAEEYDRQVREAQAPKPDDSNNPPPPAPDDPPAPPAPTPAPPAPSADPEEQTWKQRFNSLQGMYNSMVPALQQQVKDLTASITELKDKLKEAPAPTPAPSRKQELVTKSDVETFGADLIDMARRVAQEEFGAREEAYVARIAGLENELKAAKGQVDGVAQSQQRTAQDQFFDRLDAALPQWEKLQETEECKAFLASRIPGVGATWNQVLQTAAKQLDLKSVLEVYDSFFQKHPNLNPKAAPAPAPTPAPATRQELERQVAPRKSTSSAPATDSKPTYTAVQYEQESRKLLTLMREKKWDAANALEKELNLALAEGRVRP